MIKYDYNRDLFNYNGVDYDLTLYRRWLLYNHEQLCNGHFIKAVRVGQDTKFTYDWQSIFLKAEEYQFLNDYIHERSTRETS